MLCYVIVKRQWLSRQPVVEVVVVGDAAGQRTSERSEEHSEHGALRGDGSYDEHGVLPVENFQHEVSRRREDEAADAGAADRHAGRERSTLLEVVAHCDDGWEEHEPDTET